MDPILHNSTGRHRPVSGRFVGSLLHPFHSKCGFLLHLYRHFSENSDILQVLEYLFQAKKYFSANNFVPLCPRNRTDACPLGRARADNQRIKSNILGHN